ncbi:MAG: NUDIX hydrolase [Microgenomates group bacterium]
MRKTYATVIGVVRHGDKILLLKRSPSRHSSPNKWQPISGYIREKEVAEDAVLREVKEETGLKGKIIKTGRVFEVTDKWGRWVIMTFLVEVASTEISIDKEEHSEAVWIKPEEINKYNLVAGVEKDLKVLQLL